MDNKPNDDKKRFFDTKEAFEYFIEHVYPNLPSEKIKKIKQYISFFKSGLRPISEKKLEGILEEYGDATIKKEIIF